MFRYPALCALAAMAVLPLACRGNNPQPKGEMYGKHRLFDTRYDEAKQDKAKENAADVITQLRGEPNVCLVGLWAYNPPNILQAVKEAGLEGKIKIVGFDEDEATLRGIKDGHIHATVVQQPFQFGYDAVKAMHKAGKKKVAIVTNNPAEFWTIVESGARKAEKEFGVELEFQRPKNATAEEQETYVKELITRGFEAVAISIINPELQKDFLDKTAEKMLLVALDNDAPNTKREMYIGTDNYAAGQAVGKLVKEALPDGGTIAIFVGRSDSLNAIQRRQGLLDELAGKDDSQKHAAKGAVNVPHRVIKKDNVEEFHKELKALMKGS